MMPPPERVVNEIRRYLPIYEDQMLVSFECGCWQGSREANFGYDCALHKMYVIQEQELVA